jgi:hypothetical protein
LRVEVTDQMGGIICTKYAHAPSRKASRYRNRRIRMAFQGASPFWHIVTPCSRVRSDTDYSRHFSCAKLSRISPRPAFRALLVKWSTWLSVASAKLVLFRIMQSERKGGLIVRNGKTRRGSGSQEDGACEFSGGTSGEIRAGFRWLRPTRFGDAGPLRGTRRSSANRASALPSSR